MVARSAVCGWECGDGDIDDDDVDDGDIDVVVSVRQRCG
jgi:hypothetical protein